MTIPPRRGSGWLALALATLVLVLYAPVRSFDYVNLDDDEYVYDNPQVLAGWTADSLHWALTAHHSGHWHPLTWASLMGDVHLFGADPGAAHLVNALLHAGGALLLFAWLRVATGSLWCSFFAAALFAVHPLRVESVAWVAARKDVLSGLFLMATLLAYTAWTRKRGWGRYAAVVTTYALGLTAKPTLAVVPFALLLLDVWPLRRLAPGSRLRDAARRVGEKLPLFALAAGTLTQTMQSQQAAGARVASDTLPFADRLANALSSYVAYLGKTFWPFDLAVFYPLAPVPALDALLSLGLLGLITVAAVWRLRQQPYLLVGWLWFAGTLVPVSGIVQFGGQAMADRYSYIPHIGLLAALTWAAADVVRRFAIPRLVVVAVAVAVVAACAATSSRQLQHWQNSITLFEHAVRVTADNYMAHNNLGVALGQLGDREGASHHFREAVRINPTWPEARNNFGNDFAWRGQYAEARVHYAAALARRPDFAVAENNMATAYAFEGNFPAAVHHYRRAVAIDPGYLDARFALADALERTGALHEAEVEYAVVAEARPDWPDVARALARVRAALR